MGSRRAPRRSIRGFSLFELVIAVGVLGILLTTLLMIQLRTVDASESMQARDGVEAQARRTLDLVVGEFTGVGRNLIFPDPSSIFGASSVTFQRPTGVSGAGVVLWGNPSRLDMVLDPGETDNGIDDDADGLVDERELVLTRDFGTAGARSVVLCTDLPELSDGETQNGVDDNGNGVVDEAGFNVRRVGDLLTVRICVRQPFAGNQFATTSLATSVVLHN